MMSLKGKDGKWNFIKKGFSSSSTSSFVFTLAFKNQALNLLTQQSAVVVAAENCIYEQNIR